MVETDQNPGRVTQVHTGAPETEKARASVKRSYRAKKDRAASRTTL